MLWSILKIWKRDTGGSTAVEFALVGAPFVLMTIGIVELSLMFTTQSLLYDSTFSAARIIRTGQLQSSGGAQDVFRDEVCEKAAMLIPCNEIQFTVQTVPSFADAEEIPPQYDANGNLLDQSFDPGGANDVVLIRASYNYPIKTPLMQPLLANNGFKRTLVSTVVLRTEPYE